MHGITVKIMQADLLRSNTTLTISISVKAPFLLQSNLKRSLMTSQRGFYLQFWLCGYSHAIIQCKRAIMWLFCGNSVLLGWRSWQLRRMRFLS
jgi:hypothetical protein